ncbi:unnamed protein product, partial [Ectocarpus sp. 12 AP-2014]
MLMHKDRGGQSILGLAVSSGNPDVVGAVLAVCRQELTNDQLKAMLIHEEGTGRSILGLAVSSGNPDVVAAVLAVCRQELTNDQ